MRQIFKRLLAPLLLMTALPTSVSQADGIRLVGPTGEVQSSPSFSEQVERANSPLPVSDEPSRFYGPTSANETLWSIASKLRPANNVSVQQTLLAIYRLNPQAFENQNIHSLVSGSTLRVPSLAQVRSASTEQAVTVMKAHQDKLNATPRPIAPTPVTRPVKVTPATPAQAVSETVKVEPQIDTTPVKTPEVPQVKTLEKQLEMSESELTALEEKNHNLRLMLAEVQSEVDGLKTELGDENRIRSEVEKLLAEEKAKLEEQQRMQPSAFDQFLSNGWMVAAAALIPGALIGLLIVMLLGRRKEAEPSASETQTEAPLTPPPMSDSDLDDLTDDLTLDDDLFSDSDDNSELLFDDSMGEDENDVFGDLDDSDLDFNLEGEDGEDPFASIGDDGDLDTDFDDFDSSNNGISVKGSDKALGLEEMERALDEVSPELEITDDEESDFDLSGENVGMSEDDLAELLASDEPTEDLGDSALDQSMLDDLFSNLGDDDEVDEFDLGLDEDSAAAPTENKQMSDAMSGTMASDEDIDQLLAQFDEPVIDESELDTQSSLDELESLLESGADDTQDDLSTSLLDEMLEQASDDEVSLDPLDELEALAGLSDDEIEVSLTDTELLDELLEADEEESLDEFDPLSELEELAAFGQDEVVPELDENSTDLLDELLESAPESDESLEWPVEELATEEESDLFDELIGLDESDKAQKDDAAEPFDFAAELDAALDSSEDFVELSVSEPAIEEGNAEGDLVDNSAIDDLLDDVLPLEEASPKQDEQAAEVEELVEAIDSSMAGDEFEPTEFNSSHFVEDLANVAPTLDPLLDAFPEDIEEGSNAEAELDTDPQPLQESLDDSSEALLEEAAPSEPVLPSSDPLADLPLEEGESGDVDDIDAQDDQDDDWLQAAIDEVESPLDSIDEYQSTTQTETAEQELLSDHEIATTTPELDVEESQEPQEEDWLQSAIDEVESPHIDLEQHEVDSDEHLASTPLATEVTEEALDEHPDDTMLSELDDTPAQDDELVDLVDDIAEPVSTDAEALLAQDIEDAQALEAPSAEMPLEEPVLETPTPNAVPNEFGTPIEEDWAEAETLFDGLATDSELPQTQQEESLAGLAEAESTAEQDDSLDDLELLEFDEDDALEALADESVQEANAVLGEDAIGLDELALTEFGEDDELAVLADEPGFAEPSLESELEDIDLDELDFPEFGEEEALASLEEEPMLSEVELSESDLATPPIDETELLEQAESAVTDLDDIEFDENELPEFGEEDALSAMADEPSLADFELDEPVAEGEIDLADEVDFDELELPEFGEDEALAAMADEPSYEAPVVEEDAFAAEEPAVEFEITSDESALDEVLEPSEAATDNVESAEEQAQAETTDDAFDVDELELPEFGEDEALAAMADEPSYDAPVVEEDAFATGEPAVESEITSEESALDDVLEPSKAATDNAESAEEQVQAETTDDAFDFDELELPEFGEDEALAAMADEPSYDAPVVEEDAFAAEEPAVESETTSDESTLDDVLEPSEAATDNVESAEEQAQVETTDDAFDFDELELPEFGEDEALAAMVDEPSYDAPVVEEDAFAAEEPAVESEITSDESALDDVLEPSKAATDNVENAEEQAQAETTDDEFDFDELELPEFGEDEAAEAVASEPNIEPDAEPEAELDDFEIDDIELPEFGEEDAIVSVAEELDEAPITSEPEEQDYHFDSLELPSIEESGELNTVNKPHINPSSYEEQDALFDVFAQEAGFNIAEEEVLHSEFDEAAMADLLSEEALDDNFFPESPDDEMAASAGMDIEAMLEVGGDDWNGFKLPDTPSAEVTSDVPADEREIWSSEEALRQPNIDEENWAEQDDFDPKKNQYMTIDELMAQVDGDEVEFEEEDLKLDVGLDEFPDVIGDISNVDVDENAEAAGKLDLAKIYIEMNDAEGAIKLLEEAIVYGDDVVRREAKNLIDMINGR
ncbi:FimV/HubP family polar landmark protein [Vibrio vulnificus]|uniref:FimV/HubP family polar landmark protein n=1 Tax=Vibrio vulnificus TaxID=672 RepID=UPI0024DFDE9B|nr:FimV/HubP family polar landmark protein [Vibrio vulnificus]MDK2604151.1 FimV/HubP family polar landmark protein [Vibrio vulnificus]MDK2626144.1 FimV/HubP family polar landmark protein [Vibrio vulnificus]MDK2643568.1 FimV/HubP family polar landmark protein [Vibrio vulnificus]MDK2720955.1 FimV/HubP family polar landmark protein [Vibrio vulnificus]MDK2724714.1 FimV/HubP family polar landmark protein [Vibrio vulnificus]